MRNPLRLVSELLHFAGDLTEALGEELGKQVKNLKLDYKVVYAGSEAALIQALKDKTTVRLAPVKISGDRDKYHSLHISPSFSYPGQRFQVPSTIDFELQTVVKGKLRVDLYVVFIVDGETIFLSSNRSGVKRPVAGRSWMGERLVFNMPYQTLLKIAAAKTLAIKMDAVMFEVGQQQHQAIRDFAKHIQSLSLNSLECGALTPLWSAPA